MSLEAFELFAVIFYLLLVLAVAYFSYQKSVSAKDFIIGDRSLNYWLTALAAHGSDMSSWLFMGYPSVIFMYGLPYAWAGIGLMLFMYLNWQFIAPKIRIATEQYNSLTFSSFFESRLVDTSGMIRIITAVMSLVFYTIYISAGLVAMGILAETLFNTSYTAGITVGILIVIPYVFIGGYRTLAWIDLFQGTFLMLVIIFVPLYILDMVGGWDMMAKAIDAKGISLKLIPDFSLKTLTELAFLTFGWGLGYFGQPHIITKFMGIRKVSEMRKSKWVGMSWMTIALGAATFVGIVGIAAFPQGLEDPEQVFIQMVKQNFHPFLIGFFLCAVLAATINTMSSQVLVLTSSLTEDFYKRLIRKDASSSELLLVSRIGVILSSAIAYVIAFPKFSTIFELVLYAWSGLGSSFGPLLIFSLYFKRMNKYGAWAGIIVGGMLAAIWPYLNKVVFTFDVPSMIVGFSMGSLAIYTVSLATENRGRKKAA